MNKSIDRLVIKLNGLIRKGKIWGNPLQGIGLPCVWPVQRIAPGATPEETGAVIANQDIIATIAKEGIADLGYEIFVGG